MKNPRLGIIRLLCIAVAAANIGCGDDPVDPEPRMLWRTEIADATTRPLVVGDKVVVGGSGGGPRHGSDHRAGRDRRRSRTLELRLLRAHTAGFSARMKALANFPSIWAANPSVSIPDSRRKDSASDA